MYLFHVSVCVSQISMERTVQAFAYKPSYDFKVLFAAATIS